MLPMERSHGVSPRFGSRLAVKSRLLCDQAHSAWKSARLKRSPYVKTYKECISARRRALTRRRREVLSAADTAQLRQGGSNSAGISSTFLREQAISRQKLGRAAGPRSPSQPRTPVLCGSPTGARWSKANLTRALMDPTRSCCGARAHTHQHRVPGPIGLGLEAKRYGVHVRRS
jgi:hypothetical protein